MPFLKSPSLAWEAVAVGPPRSFIPTQELQRIMAYLWLIVLLLAVIAAGLGVATRLVAPPKLRWWIANLLMLETVPVLTYVALDLAGSGDSTGGFAERLALDVLVPFLWSPLPGFVYLFVLLLLPQNPRWRLRVAAVILSPVAASVYWIFAEAFGGLSFSWLLGHPSSMDFSSDFLRPGPDLWAGSQYRSLR